MRNTLRLQLSLAEKLGIIDDNKIIHLIINSESSVDIPRIRVKEAAKLFGDYKVYKTEIVEGCGAMGARPTLLFNLSQES